jgi:hypothetical protein
LLSVDIGDQWNKLGHKRTSRKNGVTAKHHTPEAQLDVRRDSYIVDNPSNGLGAGLMHTPRVELEIASEIRDK